jgi:hypothetical protein
MHEANEPDISAHEQEVLAACLVEWNLALDAALDSIRSARMSIRESLDEIARLQADSNRLRPR